MPAKSERLEVRVSREHKQLLERAAAVTGQGLSAFAVSNLVERAREVLDQHERTTLTLRDRGRFLEILEESEPTEALRTAVRRHRRDG